MKIEFDEKYLNEKNERGYYMKETDKDHMSLQELILDHAPKKYRLVNYAIRWAKEIARKEDAPKTTQGLLNAALRDIITGKITPKEIDKLPPVKESKKESKSADASEKNGKKTKKKD